MKNKDRKSVDAAQLYVREMELLQGMKEIEKRRSLSADALFKEFTLLGQEYEKLLKQAIKITRIGDASQWKLMLANEEIERQKEELGVAYRKMESLARTDPLTNLSNRRDFYEKLVYEKFRSERGNKAFSLVLGDIDNFKSYNDRFGHDCGDFILVETANIIKSVVRKQDVVGRWGGEEFILLLPEATLSGGERVAESIRQKIAEESFCFNKNRFSLTMTFGVSEFDGFSDIDPCIKMADEALYLGKIKGKNCVVLAGGKQKEITGDQRG